MTGSELRVLACLRGASVRYAVRRGLLGTAGTPVLALREVSLTLRAGESLALVGESGSGKSTIARLLLGLVEPSDGTLEVRARRAAVFQDPNASLNPRQRVGAALAEVLWVRRRLGGPAAAARTRELLARVDLEARVAEAWPHELSGGQLQRVAIARALASEPELLVCDEVLSALDVSVQAQIVALLDSLCREQRLTLAWVTHDLAAARALTQRIAVVYAGRIVEQGPTDQVLSAPAHPYTRALLDAEPRLSSGVAPRALDGEPPSASSAPAGCAFHPRCAGAERRCASEAPPRLQLGQQRTVECWLADDQASAKS